MCLEINQKGFRGLDCGFFSQTVVPEHVATIEAHAAFPVACKSKHRRSTAPRSVALCFKRK